MKVSQGRRLIDLLRRRGYTSMELLMTGISTCWWKRVEECLAPGENLLVVYQTPDGLNVYRVVDRDEFSV